MKPVSWARSCGAGGTPLEHQRALPEQCRIASASHEGHCFRHARQWHPPTCRIQPLPRKREPIPGERELLYLALYRDKVEEAVRQQEALARSPSPSRTRTASLWTEEQKRGTAATLATAGVGDAPRAEEATGSVFAAGSAAEHGTNGEQARIASSWPSQGGFAASAAASRTPRGGNNVAHNALASVQVSAPQGGVVSEHLEAKRLGKLFDEWRAKQEEEGVESTFLGVQGTRNRWSTASTWSGAGPTMTASYTHMTASYTHKSSAPFKAVASLALESDSPPGKWSSTQEHLAPTDLQLVRPQDALDNGLGDSDFLSIAAPAEKSKAERLFGVMTNPKTRMANFADKAAEREAPLPTYIEGFPTLMLAKLYAGPWRRDI